MVTGEGSGTLYKTELTFYAVHAATHRISHFFRPPYEIVPAAD